MQDTTPPRYDEEKAKQAIADELHSIANRIENDDITFYDRPLIEQSPGSPLPVTRTIQFSYYEPGVGERTVEIYV